MKRLKAIVVGVMGGVMLAGGLTYTMNANAVYCCDPWGVPGSLAFQSAGNSVIASISNAMTQIVNEIETGVLDSWENGIGKAAAEMSKQSAARKTFHEGSVQAQNQLYLEGKRAEAMADLPKKEHIDQSVVNSMFLAEQVGIEMRNRGDLGSALVERTMYAPYQDPARERLARSAKWCTPSDKQMGLCTTVADIELQGGDRNFPTLVSSDLGLTLSDARREAAADFIATVVDSNLRAQAQSNTAQAQQADAGSLADQALMSVAINSFTEMTAERTRRNQPALPAADRTNLGSSK